MTRFLCLVLFCIFPNFANAQTIAIIGGKVITNTKDGHIENGTVLIKDGHILAVGTSGSIKIPAAAQIVSAKGKWVTPGLFIAYSRVGLVEVSMEKSTNDTRAQSAQFSAALRAKDSFNPKSDGIANTRIEGITRMHILPDAGHTLYGGQGALVNSTGSFYSGMGDHPTGMFVQMGQSGAALAGGSRSAAWTWLRQSMIEAKAWRNHRPPPHPLLPQSDAHAIQQTLQMHRPFFIAVERASDLINLIALKKELNIEIIAVGASEGWMVAKELSAANIPVIVDPHDNLPSRFETIGATMYNAKRLVDAGVVVAIASLHDEAFNARLAPQHAGNTLATGMKWDDAFAAITKVPAKMFGLENELGSLAAGMIADVVIWDGDPLELMSSPDQVLIDGVFQDMHSRQTRLRDRYMHHKSDTKLPFAYR